MGPLAGYLSCRTVNSPSVGEAVLVNWAKAIVACEALAGDRQMIG